ncbi:MAG: hypothetical protein IJR12_00035 [Bacteroidales bacterium]|nr:hypothetical protein [Bacteroidales bacterium]
MKKIFADIAVLSAVIFLFSCAKPGNNPSGDTPGKEEVKPEPVSLTLSFVLPEGGEKTAWVAGDQIVVHGEYAKDKVTVTLAASDISSDGKTASLTVDGLVPYIREDVGSTLYAGYPADAVDLLPHCFFYTKFNTSNRYLLAACNDSQNKFQFFEVCSRLSFSVDGDFDSYAITGRKDAVTGYEAIQVKITDKEQNLNQYREGALVTVSGKLDSGTKAIYVPAGTVLPAGFDLKFFKDGEAKKVFTEKEEVSFKESGLDLGNITSKIKDFVMDLNVSDAVSLSDEGTANCYIVTAPGTYKIAAVKGFTEESVGTIETTAVLWETMGNTAQVEKGSLIDATLYEGGYMYFRIPEPFVGGNALIAAMDEEEHILWSWHIWMPKTPVTDVEETNFATLQIMDRNVGALVAVPSSGAAPAESFGLLYQWGRKDPFPGIGDPSTSAPATIAEGQEITYVNDQISIAGGAQNPNVFYYLDDKDWQNEGNDPVAALWGEAKKTVYDPCPAGYALPQRNNSCPFWAGSDISGAAYFTLDAENYRFTVGNLTFPLSGYIDDADGTHKGAGTDVQIWSGRWDSGTQNGYGLTGVVGDQFRRRGQIRSRGGSVRCVKL